MRSGTIKREFVRRDTITGIKGSSFTIVSIHWQNHEIQFPVVGIPLERFTILQRLPQGEITYYIMRSYPLVRKDI